MATSNSIVVLFSSGFFLQDLAVDRFAINFNNERGYSC